MTQSRRQGGWSSESRVLSGLFSLSKLDSDANVERPPPQAILPQQDSAGFISLMSPASYRQDAVPDLLSRVPDPSLS